MKAKFPEFRISVDQKGFENFMAVLSEINLNWLNFRNSSKCTKDHNFQRSWIWSNDFMTRSLCESSDFNKFLDFSEKESRELIARLDSEDEDMIVDEDAALGRKKEQERKREWRGG